ncbi:MAG: PAS domain-containing protein [Candidatus Omnitrophota bacterium]
MKKTLTSSIFPVLRGCSLLAAPAFLFVLTVFAFAAEPPEIRAGSELDFRPYCFTDKNGQPTGFGVELLKAVANKMGLRLRITPMSWDMAWNSLVAGDLDVLPVVARTPGREPLVDFSLPHTETFDAFFVREGRAPFKDIAEASGKEIVVLRSDAAHHELRERKFIGRMITVESIPEGMRMIAAGRHDAMLCSKLVGVLECRQANIHGVQSGPPIPDYKRVFSFAVRKGNAELTGKLDQGLRILKASGEYDRIYSRWLGMGNTMKLTWWEYFWRVIGIFIMLFIFAAVWYMSRKTDKWDERLAEVLAPRLTWSMPVLLRYVLASGIVVAATALRVALIPWLGTSAPYNFILVALVVTTTLFGTGPGLLSIVFGNLAVEIFVLRAPLSEGATLLRMGVSMAISIFIVAVLQSARSAINKVRQGEGALRASEKRLNHAQEIGNIGSWEWDIATGTLIWSEQTYRQLGEEPVKFTPNYDIFIQHIHPDDRALFEAAMQGALAGTARYDLEFRIAQPNGVVRILHSQGEVLRGPDGKPQRMFGVSIDITARKLAEEELRQSRKTFAELIERAPFGIYVVDAQFCIANMNASSQNGAFQNVRPVIGRSFNEAMHILWPDTVAEKIIAHFRHTLDTGEPYYSPQFINPRHDEKIVESYEWELHRMTLQGGQFGVICYYFDSTKLRNTERELRESEGRFRLALKNSPVLVAMQDSNFVYQWAYNTRTRRAEDIIGKTDADLFAPEDMPELLEAKGRVLRDGTEVRKRQWLTSNGQRVYLDCYYEPVRDPDGRIIGVGIAAVNLTDQKLAEEALERTRNILSEAQKIAHLGSFEYIAETRATIWSKEEYRIYGLDLAGPSPEYGEMLAKCIHPEDAALLHETFTKAIQAKSIYELEHRIVRPDGSVRWVYDCAHPYCDEKGNLLRYVGATLDITERKLLEDELKRNNETLEERVRMRSEEVIAERQRLFDVLETLPVYVILLDKDYRVPFANKFFRERFGDSQGKRCYEYLFNKNAECENCETYKVMRTRLPHHWEWLGPDGRNYDIYDFPFKDTDGSDMIMEMGIDITEQKHAVNELIEAKMELERAKRLSDIGVLASTVAHELRNPLAAIGMAAYNIKRKANNPNFDKHLANIDKKVAESNQIINNLLFYSRLRPPHFEQIGIFDILEESIESAEAKNKKEIPVIRNTASFKGISVEADSHQMKEVFVNILNNAHEALPADSGEIKITSAIDDEYITISIEDNGPGIAQDIIDKIFDPFFTTKAKGTGLGLAVCRQIVVMHDGEISVKHGITKGTCIVVRLPKERRKE